MIGGTFLLALLTTAAPPDRGEVEVVREEAQAIHEELKRGIHKLRVESSPAPYYAEARVVRADLLGLDGSYGGIITDVVERQTAATVDVRIGGEALDNSNFFGGDGGGIRFSVSLQPDATYSRRRTWLAMDSAFRSATRTLSQKKAVLDRLATTLQIPDFSPGAKQGPRLEGGASEVTVFDRAGLGNTVKLASRRFEHWPSIDNGDVHIQVLRTHQLFVDSEGMMVDWIQKRAVLAAVADTQAPDGMRLDHGRAIHFQEVPGAGTALTDQAAELTDRVLRELRELVEAPLMEEDYDGPILLVGDAAPQFLAATVATQASGDPPPLSEIGRVTDLEPAWQRRLGKTVLPPDLDLVDDPGTPGFGHYRRDAQGFVPRRLGLVRRGRLESLLMTRTPNRVLRQSNGRARMTPALQVGPAISNLALTSRRSGLSTRRLESELLRRARKDGYDFAYVVELFRDGTILGPVPRETATASAGTGKIDLPLPARLYRLHGNGKKTLVRGAILAPVSIRALRRIRAVGANAHVVPMRIPLGAAGGFGVAVGMDGVLGQTVDVQVTSPDLLVEGLELLVERGEQERPPTLVHPLRRTSAATRDEP